MTTSTDFRFLTCETYCGQVSALTESEFSEFESLDDFVWPLEIADWVWQRAEDKESAIKAHADKVDLWFADPSKNTY